MGSTGVFAGFVLGGRWFRPDPGAGFAWLGGPVCCDF